MYRDIPRATKYGDHESGHHFVNLNNKEQQFTVDVNWTKMTVSVRELASNGQWTEIIVPLSICTSPADNRF